MSKYLHILSNCKDNKSETHYFDEYNSSNVKIILYSLTSTMTKNRHTIEKSTKVTKIPFEKPFTASSPETKPKERKESSDMNVCQRWAHHQRRTNGIQKRVIQEYRTEVVPSTEQKESIPLRRTAPLKNLSQSHFEPPFNPCLKEYPQRGQQKF